MFLTVLVLEWWVIVGILIVLEMQKRDFDRFCKAAGRPYGFPAGKVLWVATLWPYFLYRFIKLGRPYE